MDIPPNQTLYVNNLPEKINKQGRAPMLSAHRKCGTVPLSTALLSVSACPAFCHPSEWLIHRRAAYHALLLSASVLGASLPALPPAAATGAAPRTQSCASCSTPCSGSLAE